jgi:hypothetical protein
MKFGLRIPSLTKRIAARTSLKRVVRHNLGFKAPKGFGWFTNPKKAAYNKVYNKTSRGCLVNLIFLVSFGVLTFSVPSCDFKKSENAGGVYVKPTITRTGKFRKGHVRKNVSTNKNAISGLRPSHHSFRKHKNKGITSGSPR